MGRRSETVVGMLDGIKKVYVFIFQIGQVTQYVSVNNPKEKGSPDGS